MRDDIDRMIGACNFSNIPESELERVNKALDDNDWEYLALVNHNYKVCPWEYCCGKDALLVINLFKDARKNNFL